MKHPKTWRCSTCGEEKLPASFARAYSKTNEATPLVCLSCIVIPAPGDYIKHGHPTTGGTKWKENKADKKQIAVLNRALSLSLWRLWEHDDGTPDDEAWAAHVERATGLKAGAY